MLRIHNPSGGSAVTSSQPFTGATTDTNGLPGLVPGPAAGQEEQVLLGSGVFGQLTAAGVFCYDRYNLCGGGENSVVTLQTLINTVISKLQARTVFNWNESAESSTGQESEEIAEMFQKEYVVDTYGYAGTPGTTVTTSQLLSAMADTFQSRTIWTDGESNPISGDTGAVPSNNVQSSNDNGNIDDGEPEDDGLKDQVLDES